MNKIVIQLLFLLLFLPGSIFAQQTNNPQQVLNQTNTNFFIANKGQWPAEVKFLARIGGMDAWITNSGVVYNYYKIKRNYDETELMKLLPIQKREFESKNITIQGNVVRIRFVNSNKDVKVSANNKRQGYYNYFIGNDKSKWASYVPLYENVEVKNVYEGIDVKYYYDNGTLRYDYEVQPWVDLSQIKLSFKGQDELQISPRGELIIKTNIGEVKHGKIYAYQLENGKETEVQCKFYKKEDGKIGLKATAYNASKKLIVDPLIYSTFIGNNGNDKGNSIAVDTNDNAYITGYTSSPDYPITSGAFQSDTAGGVDVFVTKLDSTSSGLVYSTFFGGDNGDITGYTYSSDYPATRGAFQTVGGGDAFVTKLNSTGSDLVYSTFIGGAGYRDEGNSISVNAKGEAFITGETSAPNYPTTDGAFQTVLGKFSIDAFVTKLNSTGSALIYSTYIGGGDSDYAYSIAVNANDEAYITGLSVETAGSDYPTTDNAFQTASSGFSDVFVTKFNSTGSDLVYSTFIGRGSGRSIAINEEGEVYITGNAGSDYPTTNGAFQTTSSHWGDVFVTKLNSSGSALIYSTFIGGDEQEQGNSIAIDANGNAYIAGVTGSSDYPTTSGAFQIAFGGGGFYNEDAFVTKLNSTGSALIYSTYIGGSDDERGNSNCYRCKW